MQHEFVTLKKNISVNSTKTENIPWRDHTISVLIKNDKNVKKCAEAYTCFFDTPERPVDW